MGSARASEAAADLTTRARIRDAAIHRIGVDGVGASVRAIAEQAGVSPGLVIHHFGSKDGLRAACDEHVLRAIRESKSTALASGSAPDLLAQLAAVQEFAPLVAYIVQSMLTGGALATAFLDQMIADAEAYLAAGVAAGTVRPSRDPAARARYLVLAGVGALLLHVRLHPPVGGDYAATIRELTALTAVPALEIYTEGLLTDRTMLDSYLMYVPDPPRR
ncbi:TetR family transcriptional regulator [Pseudonocardia hispaniensis]|uniref:TetR family transcriptional regulator n=1 Tax=Pseudonocardia hispaniensis TaxID=904933 RepID=A0ABW1IZP8_9PSEU